MLGLGLSLGGTTRLAQAVEAVAGIAATAFPLAPTVHYHPHAQAGSVTKDGTGRVLSCPDLAGLAALSGVSAAGATVGPVEMTDGLGRRFWRFEAGSYALVANTLAGMAARGLTVMLAARVHRPSSAGIEFFSPRYSAYTDDAANTSYSGGGIARVLTPASGAPRLYCGVVDSFNDAAAQTRMIAGAQRQVIGVASRTTAGGGTRFILDGHAAGSGQHNVATATSVGGVIGGVPGGGNGATSAAGFDLYEIAIWKGELTDAQADAASAAMLANHAIQPATSQIVLEGDSITQGMNLVTSGRQMAMILTDPGGPLAVPAGWRVVNMAVQGNQIADLVAKRNAATGVFGRPLPGRNVIFVQIGRNDLGAGAKTAQQVHDGIVSLLDTATTGYLQRGWEVRQAVNIATTAALAAELANLRALLRSPDFLAACDAGPGQAHAGKLSLVDLPLITVPGKETIFDTVADAADLVYYAGDSTHPTLAATVEITRAYRAAL